LTPSQLRNDLQNAYDLMLEKGFSIYNQPLSYEQNGSTIRVTWRQSGTHFGTFNHFCGGRKINTFFLEIMSLFV